MKRVDSQAYKKQGCYSGKYSEVNDLKTMIVWERWSEQHNHIQQIGFDRPRIIQGSDTMEFRSTLQTGVIDKIAILLLQKQSVICRE